MCIVFIGAAVIRGIERRLVGREPKTPEQRGMKRLKPRKSSLPLNRNSDKVIINNVVDDAAKRTVGSYRNVNSICNEIIAGIARSNIRRRIFLYKRSLV